MPEVDRHRQAVPLDGAGHAAGSAPSRPSSLPSMVMTSMPACAQHGVGVDVALVADDDAGRDGEDVVAVVPLLALGGSDVLAAGGEDPDLVERRAPSAIAVEEVGVRGRRRASPSSPAGERSRTAGRVEIRGRRRRCRGRPSS